MTTTEKFEPLEWDVKCPSCGAEPHNECTVDGIGVGGKVHATRYDAFIAWKISTEKFTKKRGD